jgi:hypothetical protein
MKKKRGDESVRPTVHKYIWNNHKETPCVATLPQTSKNIIFFCKKKSENRRTEQILLRGIGGSGVWCQWKGRRRGKGERG